MKRKNGRRGVEHAPVVENLNVYQISLFTLNLASVGSVGQGLLPLISSAWQRLRAWTGL